MVKDAPLLKKKKSFEELRKKAKHITIEAESRTKRIKKLLGDNFIGTRRSGKKLEIITHNDISEKDLKKIKKIWSRESDGE